MKKKVPQHLRMWWIKTDGMAICRFHGRPKEVVVNMSYSPKKDIFDKAYKSDHS